MKEFKKDVELGLKSAPKKLPSKYFYDKVGDELFVKIMHSPEYYLTRAELEVFQHQSLAIIEELNQNRETYFELIELGAGDGLKTKELLAVLLNEKYRFGYFPVDISGNALNDLEEMLKKDLPLLKVEKQQGDYFKILESLKDSAHPKVVLFLGSNIGNMSDQVASKFIYDLGANLRPGDMLLLGVDLIKSPDIVLPAYNDSNGYTRDFNLNLLHRINVELGGDFDLNKFSHLPEYEQNEGVARSFLQSEDDQKVTIHEIGETFDFKKGEKIHTEISRKYDDEILKSIISQTDFKVVAKFTDSNTYFADYILKRN